MEIVVPKGWRVSLTGRPVFGGCADHTERPSAPDAPVLRVNTTTLFGGVDIRNEPN